MSLEGAAIPHAGGCLIRVQTKERISLEEIRAVLEASAELGFKGRKREERYGWVGETLRQQGYEGLKRSGRGLVRRYVEKMTGLSRAQTTRLIRMYLGGEAVKAEPYRPLPAGVSRDLCKRPFFPCAAGDSWPAGKVGILFWDFHFSTAQQ